MTDESIKIKQASECDITIIENIMLDVINFLDSIGQPQWEPQNVTWNGLSRYFKPDDFYIAYIDEIPVGCMALIDNDPIFWPDIRKGESLFIHKLAVKRCAAKKGVSKALIDFAKTTAIKSGINVVRLDSHMHRLKVREMYEREGFICVSEKVLFGKYATAFYEWKNEDKPSSCFCGHDCSRCLTYLDTVNNNDELRLKSQQFYKDEFNLDIPLEELHCLGGWSKDVFYLCKGCPWMKCAKEKRLSACSECAEYPCKPLAEYREKYINKCNQIGEKTNERYF